MYAKSNKIRFSYCALVLVFCTGWDYSKSINEYGNKYNVDPILIEAVIAKESSGRVQVSGVDSDLSGWSHGLMQLKYETAVSEGFKGELKALFVPSINIKYGTKYLARCIEWAGGDWKLALDYYNRGIGTAKKYPYKGKWEKHPYVGYVLKYMKARRQQ